MRSVAPNSWTDISAAIAKLRAGFGARRIGVPGKAHITLAKRILSRGQSVIVH